MWSIQRRGFDELQAKLSKPTHSLPIERAMADALTILQQEASRFPPQPSRTRAKTFNTWVREVGRLPRSAFGISRTTGKPTIRRGGRRVLVASEKMLKKWKEAPISVQRTAAGYVGRIVNKASYGQFVQGEKQAKFHARTPWLTTKQIQDKHARRVVAVFEGAVKKWLNSF